MVGIAFQEAGFLSNIGQNLLACTCRSTTPRAIHSMNTTTPRAMHAHGQCPE